MTGRTAGPTSSRRWPNHRRGAAPPGPRGHGHRPMGLIRPAGDNDGASQTDPGEPAPDHGATAG